MMSIPDRYDAFWIPGPEVMDMDEGLRLGYRWLDNTRHRGSRVVVLNVKKMLNNRRTLAAARRYHVVSPRARDVPSFRTVGPVLAIWPSTDTLELAQQLAIGSALCAIPYRHSIDWWIARTGAVNLAEPRTNPVTLPFLDTAVSATLDSILGFGGHNSFVGAGEKETTVRELRAMLTDGHRPAPSEVEDYARASGETDVEGARRLRSFYEGVLAGKQLRDSGGRAI